MITRLVLSIPNIAHDDKYSFGLVWRYLMLLNTDRNIYTQRYHEGMNLCFL